MTLQNPDTIIRDWTPDLQGELICLGIPEAAFRSPFATGHAICDTSIIDDCYYHYTSKSYYRKDCRGFFIPVTGEAMREFVYYKELPVPDDERTAYVAKLMLTMQAAQNVEHAGGVAGHKPGVVELPCGRRILVTVDAPPLVPMTGDFPTIQRYLGELLLEKRIYFDLFLKSYLTDLLRVRELGIYKANPYPVPILALVGPSSAGKSLLVRMIKTMVGGRVGLPLQFLTGKTAFNYDLVEAELQVVDDEAASKDFRDRRTLTAQLKTLQFSGEVRCHPKGGKPVTLRPFQMFIFLANDEPENMQVLPIIDESMVGKIMLLKAHRSFTANSAKSKEERDAFISALEAELPAYMAYLLSMDTPSELCDPRTGIKCFLDPDLLDSLRDLTPEDRFIEAVDMLFEAPNACFLSIIRETRPGSGLSFEEPSKDAQALFHKLLRGGNLVGTATDIEFIIRAGLPQYERQRLFPHGTSCGRLLKSASLRFPERFQQGRTNGKSKWTIHPPSSEQGT
jgi:hypothetical protein